MEKSQPSGLFNKRDKKRSVKCAKYNSSEHNSHQAPPESKYNE